MGQFDIILYGNVDETGMERIRKVTLQDASSVGEYTVEGGMT